MYAEREFLLEEGLKEQGRPWYKHIIQAPGLYLGYGADVFPSIIQPLRNGYVSLAQEQIHVVSQQIEKVANYIEHDPDRTRRNGIIASVAVLLIIFLIGGGAFLYYMKEHRQSWKQSLSSFRDHIYRRTHQSSELDEKSLNQRELEEL